jgi:hypothetical protein
MRHQITFLAAIAVAGTALLLSGRSVAATVVMDFDSTPDVWGGVQTTNLLIEGFRVSPSRHVDIFDYGNPDDYNIPSASVAMGWDSGGGLNPDFLGATCVTNCVYIDLPGQTFSLESLVHWGFTTTVISSKGGVVVMADYRDYVPTTYTFSGPEWQDVQWLLFEAIDNVGAPRRFVDDLSFAVVPIPAAAWLFGGALGMLGMLKRNASGTNA